MDSEQSSAWRIGLGVAIGIAALFFFLGSLVLVNPAQMYISPDATANAFFSEQFAESGMLWADRGPLVAAWDRIHPRSILNDLGILKPGSFLGLPVLYGALVALLGDWVLWILTPIIVLLSAFAWRSTIRTFATERIAAISTVLYLLHPALWYYSARGLMHNALFMCLLVFGAWFGFAQPLKQGKRDHWMNDFLAALSVGLALFVRTSEFLWVGAAVLVIVFWRLADLHPRRLAMLLFGAIVSLSVLFFFNLVTYGHPLTTGYTLGQEQVFDLASGDSVDSVDLLPFGFHPRSALRNFQAYGVSMFWWMSILSIFGFFTFLAQKRKGPQKMFVFLFFMISVWTVVMYGSWEIFDNPDPSQITMANSYTRYWLPMFLMATVFAASAIDWLSQKMKTGIARGVVIAGCLIVIVGLNINATFFEGQDGLMQVRETLLASNTIQASVLNQTEEDALIFVDRADKLFFPHRNVWYPLRDDATYEAMETLINEVPLYYYGITFPDEDIEYLNTSRLARMGLAIQLVETFEQESLYEIYQP